MLRLAIACLVIALVVAFFSGIGGVSHYSWEAGNKLFIIFLVLGLLSLLARALKWPYA